MPSPLSDFLHAFRVWRSQPGAIAAAIVTLALGIGVSIVIFGLVEAMVLRPLPAVEDAGSVLVTTRNPFSYQAYRAFAERQRVFNGIGAFQSQTVDLVTGGGGQPAETLFVSDGYFAALGLVAARGRLLTAADERPADALAAVISQRCWRTRFDSAPDVVGRTVDVNRTRVTIVGIVGRGFEGTELGTPVDLFLPVTGWDVVRNVRGPRAWLSDATLPWLRAVLRLRTSATARVASAEADRVFKTVTDEIPQFRKTPLGMVRLVDAAFPGFARDSSRRVMIILFGVAGCVLAVACVNVANLLLALGQRRRLEWGVRLSLGVTRGRLAGQLLAETLALVAVSSGVALLLAYWTLAALSTVRFTAYVPISLTGVVDVRVALAAIALAGVTTLACGLAPAWQGARTDVVALLGRTDGVMSRRRWTIRDLLVAAQVAASVLLVAVAVLFVTTLRNEQAVPAGFEAQGVAIARVSVRLAGYNPRAGADFFARLEERAASLPGVISVSRALNEPLGATAYVRDIALPGDVSSRRVMNTVVGPQYFRVLGIPLIEGRAFDATSPPGSVIVNETLARRLWPGTSAVGQAIEARDNASSISHVIGVASDSKYHSLREESSAFLYTNAADDYDGTQVILLRTHTDAGARALLPVLRRTVRDMDPRVPILATATLREHVASTLSQTKATAALMTTLAALATILAAVGLHAVLAFMVSMRRKEMAIRLALGARPVRLMAALAARSALAVAAGLGAGLVSAMGVERFFSSLLYEVDASDWPVLILTGFFVLTLALIAAIGPAARIARTAPASLLRE